MTYSIRLPISALGFYFLLLFLIYLGVIPSIPEIVLFLRSLYDVFGLPGLFIAAFLEGLAYIGLYFPGSLIIAIAAIFSTGTLFDLSMISLCVALALTTSSFVNYYFGKHSLLNYFLKPKEEKEVLRIGKRKGFWLSFIHPNSLGFYFYTIGAQKGSKKYLFFVPLVMFPYGLFLAYLFNLSKDTVRAAVESSYTVIILLIIWFFISIIINHSHLILTTIKK